MHVPKLLFIYPTRGRVERFFKGLDSIVNNVYDTENFFVHVAADEDDETMNNESVQQRLKSYVNVGIAYGKSHSKIHAINRDLPLYREADWDILCCHSDDMRWTFYGFDQILRTEFNGDLDKLLHVPDTDAKHLLATYYIAGRTYFERFGYIYHPSYKSLWCDNENQDIAHRLGKYKYVDCPGMLFHEHPSYQHVPFDEQYKEQQGFWNDDEANYNRRKAQNFGL